MKTVLAFKVGDAVSWISQAGGHRKAKFGIVVEVVPSLRDPKTPLRGDGMYRKHVSYVVRVDNAPPRKPTYYWPVASQLRSLDPQP